MLIGIDASRANLPRKTGTEWYSFFVIQQLKKLDPKNEYRLYSKEPLTGDLGLMPSTFQNAVLRWPMLFFWTQIRLSWEMLVRPPEVLFVPAHALPIFCRAKTVVTIHDVGFRVFPELYFKKDIIYHRFCVWFASRFADKIICPSEFSRAELVKYYPSASGKVVVIPHGAPEMNPSFIKGGGESVSRSIFPKEADRPRFLLFIGRLEKKKNIIGALKAFLAVKEKFPDLKLVLVGRAGNSWEECENFIKENNLHASVIVKGYVSEEEKDQLYRQAGLFLFPTFYEGFGMPILEAQKYGCPVVTSRFGATAEVAGDSAALVDPELPEQISFKINEILSDPAYRAQLVDSGYANSAKYTWNAAAQKTLELILKINQ